MCGCAKIKEGVALTGRNHTGLPCSVGRQTAHVAGIRPARQQRYILRQTTPTDTSEQNNTGSLGGPVINTAIKILTF